MLKNYHLFIVAYSTIFFKPISYSVENQNNFSEITAETTNYSLHEPILKEFQDYFIEAAQDPQHSPEFNQKLANIKEAYQPYLEAIQTFSDVRDIEIALSIIFVYEFYQYFFETPTQPNSPLYKPNLLHKKLQYMTEQIICYKQSININLDKPEFIKQIPTIVSNIHKKDIRFAPLLKNYIAEPTLKAFYDFINTISTEIKDDSIKNKFTHIKSIFQSYHYIINSFQHPEQITSAIGFIFAYEYSLLFTEDTKHSSDQLNSLYKNLQPYLEIIQQSPQKTLTYSCLTESIEQACGGKAKRNNHVFPSIIPNPMADTLLKEFLDFCKSEVFSFELNAQNIEQRFMPHLNTIKSCFTKDLICLIMQEIMGKYLKLSHFYLQTSDPNSPVSYDRVDSRPISYGYHKDHYTYLKITNFADKFTYKEIGSLLSEAINKNNNIILDLQNNEGGKFMNLMHLLSFFIPEKTILAYDIQALHLPYLKNFYFDRNDSEMNNLKKLVDMLKINWDQPDKPLEVTIKDTSESFKKTQQWYKYQKEQNTNELNLPLKTTQFLEDSQDMVFNQGPLIQGKIAILINCHSASCSEMATVLLKNIFPNQVKIIGSHSSGKVIISLTKFLPNSQIYFTYPANELITSKFTRLEKNPIEPDIYLTNSEEIMKAAEEWVTKK